MEEFLNQNVDFDKLWSLAWFSQQICYMFPVLVGVTY